MSDSVLMIARMTSIPESWMFGGDFHLLGESLEPRPLCPPLLNPALLSNMLIYKFSGLREGDEHPAVFPFDLATNNAIPVH